MLFGGAGGAAVGVLLRLMLWVELGESLVSDVQDHDVARGENLQPHIAKQTVND